MASKQLCKSYLQGVDKLFSPFQVWDLFYEADKVRKMLTRKIQEETLRTYLFTYSKVYDSISVVSALIYVLINAILIECYFLK